MNKTMQKAHDWVTTKMHDSSIVEIVLIAKVNETDDDGNIVQYDCIYCTIIRCILIFFIIGFVIGGLCGYFTH